SCEWRVNKGHRFATAGYSPLCARHSSLYDARLLVDLVNLVGLEVFERRDLGRGPCDVQLIDVVCLAKAESQWQLDGRQVALGGEELATTRLIPNLELDLGPDGVAIGSFSVALEGQADPVVGVAAVVSEQAGRAVVDHDDDVEIAVAVDVGIGAAAAYDRAEEIGSGSLGPDLDVKVAADFARVPEELNRLLVGLARLDLGDVGSRCPLAESRSSRPSRS